MATLLMVAAISGCSPIMSANESSNSSLADAPFQEFEATVASRVGVDFGIVLATQGSRLVIPNQRLGLPISEKARSVASSCECVTARPIQYQQSGGKPGNAIEVTIAAEPEPASAPQNLSVVLEIHTDSGRPHHAEVEFLLTNPISPASSALVKEEAP